MAMIALTGVSKRYPNAHAGARDITLEIPDGEFLVLVGPSGCGKSTLLRLIAGLETPDTGTIRIGHVDVTAVEPQARDVAMVFQSYALYPHMRVRDNLAYGLKVRGLGRAVITTKVDEVARALQLEPLLDRRPSQLSGGQRQRVALGRAMVRDPKAFLLDEPLSNLDPALRVQARAELLRLHRALKATIVYVTHDQEEALTLGQRVAVMRDGIIEQAASPAEVYARPVNTFVAGFIGSPAMNLIAAPVPDLTAPAGALIGVRPHDLVLTATPGSLRATVDLVEPRGPDVIVHLRLDIPERPPLVAVVAAAATPAVGSDVFVTVPPEKMHLFDARQGTRLSTHA
jgi:ABC-type sugar transport system ATPase subunit